MKNKTEFKREINCYALLIMLIFMSLDDVRHFHSSTSDGVIIPELQILLPNSDHEISRQKKILHSAETRRPYFSTPDGK
jgi:hypothetical protein